MAYITRYPDLDINHVGVTSMRNPDYNALVAKYYYGYYAFDPKKSLVNEALENSWISLQNNKTKQRIWADLGTPYVITQLYYENYHDSKSPNYLGASTQAGSRYDGAYEGSIWGSNIKPEAYGTYSGLTMLWEGKFDTHSNTNTSDPHYITFTNATSFQYYTIDINNNHGGNFGIGFRRIEWQENV